MVARIINLCIMHVLYILPLSPQITILLNYGDTFLKFQFQMSHVNRGKNNFSSQVALSCQYFR